MSSQDSIQTQLQKYVSKLLSNHPKILYAPNNTAADAVIDRINRTFSMLEEGDGYAAELLQGTARLKRSLQLRSQQWTVVLSRFYATRWSVSSLLDRLAVVQAAACTYQDVFHDTNLNFFQGFRDEDSLVEYAMNRAPFDNITVFSSLIFNTVDEHLPRHVIYKIRQNVSMTPSTRSARALVRYPGPRSFDDSYYRFGFLLIQDLVERAVMDIHTNGTVVEPGAFIQQAPFPCFLYDAFLLNVESVFSLILSVSWVYCVAVLVKSMVQEKENHLCEVMSVMGMDRDVMWTSWFITVMIQMSFTMWLLTALLWGGGVLPLSSPLFVFVLLELFSASSILMSIMLSTVYSQAKVATACAGIVFFMSALPSLFISIREQSLMTLVPFYIKLLCSLSSTSAFGIATKQLLYYELNGEGCSFSNFYSSPIEDESFTVAHAMGMMLVDCVLYVMLAVFIEGMRTRTQRSSWWGRDCMQRTPSLDSLSTLHSSHEHKQWFEVEPEHAEAMVRLQRVCKQYASGSRKMALQDVSLTLYQNEVTALLGHNGAGKTTTMNILTGVSVPSSGSVSIRGCPIRGRRDVLDLSLGTCPQHNVLFSHLTVYEHLLFYAQLKSSQSLLEAHSQVTDMINDLQLNAKRNELVDTLSGGMKRTLSVAIAFIGGSTTVILDEPTAGVDPFARRAIWDLINKCKQGRSILIATHLMDEADILADRIAVISLGRMRAFGSPLFLKERLGDGYLLTVVWQELNDSSEQKQNDKFMELCCVHGKPPLLVNSFVGESTYQLQGWDEDQMIALLSTLDQQDCRAEMGIGSFGVRDTTLDEILIKLTTEGQSESSAEGSCSEDASCGNVHVELPQLSYHHNNTVLLFTQLFVILYKRYVCVTRNWRTLVSQLILPAVFFAGGMSIALPSMIHKASPPLSLSTFQFVNLSSHNKTSTLFYYNQHFYEASPHDSCYVNASAIVTSLYQVAGVGAECLVKNASATWLDANWPPNGNELHREVTPDVLQDSCRWRRDYKTNLVSKPLKAFTVPSYLSPDSKGPGTSYYPSCACEKRGTALRCDPLPSSALHHRMLQTADRLVDLTGVPFNQYIINTNNHFELRFGGLGVGLEKESVPVGYGVNVSRELRMLAVRHFSKVYFNNRAFHAMPVFLNVLNNALLRAALARNRTHLNPAAYGISLINHPMQGSTEVLSFAKMMQSNDVLIAVFLVVGMAFVPAACVYFLVAERSSLSFHLQWMHALSPALYWVANLCWDLINLCVPIAVCTLVIWLFNIPVYTRSDNLVGVLLLLLLYGCSSIPMVYMMSLCFSDQANAYIAMMILNLLTGIGTCFTSYLLQLFGLSNADIAWTEHILRRVFLLFPGFCLGRGVLDIALNDYRNQYLVFIGEGNAVSSHFTWDSLYLNMTAMALIGTAAFLLTVLCDHWIHRDLPERAKPLLSERDADDSDVAAERSRVLSGDADDDVVRIDGLSKVFVGGSTKTVTAVDGIHLGVAQGECFGLLGVNGAGKTTVFKMLTRILMPSQGSVYASGRNIYSQTAVLREMGYCPQFDALYDELTPREHLYYYASIHGWDRVSVHKMTSWLLHSMRLLEYADVEAGALSGGTKRKLSTALALVGDAKMLFLDEPSSGMDPGARQFIQSVIKALSKAGKCILFTSHSMEECEALCGRLSVMVKGRLRCLGSCQHLKDKYGDGYSIRLRLNKDCSDESRLRIQQLFVSSLSDCVLKETHLAYIHLEASGVSLSSVFTLCKQALSTTDLAIDSYSVSQNNLDNVFISFVREQSTSLSTALAHRQ